MDSSRKSTWRSETEDSLNCSGQFAIGLPGRGQNDSLADSVPIPQIDFPTQNTAMNTGLLTSATTASSCVSNQDRFYPIMLRAEGAFHSDERLSVNGEPARLSPLT